MTIRTGRTHKKSRRSNANNQPHDITANTVKAQFKLCQINPLTDNQRTTFEDYDDGQHLLLHGMAGTGKTFISMYLALDEILNSEGQGHYSKLNIVRSVVPARDMGYLPGNHKEKAKVYEAPYQAICTELFGRGDAYEVLKAKGVIEFMSTSFAAGTTLDNCVILIDEVQNMNYQEQRNIITRAGENSRVIVCGDTLQDHLTSERYKEESGLRKFMSILKNVDDFSFVEFTEDDIVRSDLVKRFIIAESRYSDR